MNGSRGEGGSEELTRESWANESLPLAVRRELLERELDRLGLRKAHGRPGTAYEGPMPSAHPGTAAGPGD